MLPEKPLFADYYTTNSFIKTDCVESLAFPYDLTSASQLYEYNIAMKWKNKGVKVDYITSDGDLGQL